MAPTLHLATFRRNLLAVVVGNPLFTDAEQLRTNHSAHECACPKKLALWLKNVRRVAAEREHAEGIALLAAGIAQFEAKLAARAVARAATDALTDAQDRELRQLVAQPCLTASERGQVKAQLATLTQAQATRLIGKLWGKVLGRGGCAPFSDGSTAYGA